MLASFVVFAEPAAMDPWAWAGFALVVLASCGDAREARPVSPVAPSRETGDRAPAPTAELDPSTTCGRALTCCRAYAEAMPNVVAETACAGPAEVADEPDADERCSRMTHGWREALALLEGGVPPACQAR